MNFSELNSIFQTFYFAATVINPAVSRLIPAWSPG